MNNKILLPLNYQQDNRVIFAKTLQMAELNNSKVVLFSSVPDHASEEELDKVYHHFLELNGFYQTFFNQWKKINTPIERIIRKGDIGKNLMSYLIENKTKPQIMAQPDCLRLNKKELERILYQSAVPLNLIIN